MHPDEGDQILDDICLDAAANMLAQLTDDLEVKPIVMSAFLIFTHDVGTEAPHVVSYHTGSPLEALGMMDLVRHQILNGMDEVEDL